MNGTVLSPAEFRVLRGTANGFTCQEIARDRGVSVETVKSQRASVYRKLGAACAAHAVGVAFRCGLLTGSDID